MKATKAVCIAMAWAPILLWAQAAGGRYDGSWTTTMACDASTYMPAYKWVFGGSIANSIFHAQHGQEGGPGYLIVDGTINPDGSAKLHAKGTVQPGKAGLVTQMKGNKYDYYIEAKFTDTSGTGARDKGLGILGRPCTFAFTKETAPPAVPPPPATPPPAQ